MIENYTVEPVLIDCQCFKLLTSISSVSMQVSDKDRWPSKTGGHPRQVVTQDRWPPKTGGHPRQVVTQDRWSPKTGSHPRLVVDQDKWPCILDRGSLLTGSHPRLVVVQGNSHRRQMVIQDRFRCTIFTPSSTIDKSDYL